MDDIVEKMMQKANWLKAVSLSSHSGCHQEAELFIAAAKRIKELEEVYLGQIRIIARSRLTYKERVERMVAITEQALKG